MVSLFFLIYGIEKINGKEENRGKENIANKDNVLEEQKSMDLSGIRSGHCYNMNCLNSFRLCNHTMRFVILLCDFFHAAMLFAG